MESELIKPARINEILDNCTVFTKGKFVCAARLSDVPTLAYPAQHDTQDVKCIDIERCSECFLQQRNILNIIEYIKKNGLHTLLKDSGLD